MKGPSGPPPPRSGGAGGGRLPGPVLLLIFALGGASGGGLGPDTARAQEGASPGGAGSEPERLGIYRDWAAYRFEAQGRPVCYAATDAIERRGTPAPPEGQGGQGRASTGRAWLLVTNDPARGVRGAVSYVADRPLDASAPVRVQIGRRKFALRAKGRRAWTARPRDDLELVVAMKRGRTLLLGADLAGSGALLDSFSLLGFTRALSRITEACRLGTP